MTDRKRVAAVGLASFTACVALFLGVSGWVRGTVGDVLIVVLLVSLLALIPVGSARIRVAAVLAFAFVLEGLQTLDLVGPDSHWLLHATVGSTFDPLDLLMYVVGAGVSLVAERWWARPQAA
jgi:hypothetical protein